MLQGLCEEVHVRALEALDSDRSGAVTLAELKRACHKARHVSKCRLPYLFHAVFMRLASILSFKTMFGSLGGAFDRQMKWLGNVRTLFDCLDIDSADRRNRDSATGKRPWKASVESCN